MSAILIPSVSGIPLGNWARKSISLTVNGQTTRVTFRVRRDNGAAGGIPGRLYQDCYTYVVPANPRTSAQQAQRAKMTAAVTAWQSLSESEKNVWRKLATHSKYATGFTAFASDHILTH